MRRLALPFLAVTLALAPAAIASAAPAAAGAAAMAASAAPAADADPDDRPSFVSYQPPLDGAIVDEYDLPSQPWSAGNRGIDYATEPGSAARAAADGAVVFAGQVGGDLHVVILHADGIRTSYSFLRSISVHRGDRVGQGDTVGTTGDRLHFGARMGDNYLDPTLLFGGGPPQVHLVPEDERRQASETEERSRLTEFLRGAGGSAARAATAAAAGTVGLGEAATNLAGGGLQRGYGAASSAVADKWAELRDVKYYAEQLDPFTYAGRLAATTVDWWNQRGDCTPASVAPPPLPERRMAVLVSGLGSKSESDSLQDLDTGAIGYLQDDVVRFSYNGGTTEESSYTARDTTVDLRDSARRLRELLERINREHPGMPVDLIGHSQGGVVARTALAYEYDPDDPRFPEVANLVTLSSPHHGADIATALAVTAHTKTGEAIQWGLDATGLAPIDPRGESVRQLAEDSTFLAELNRRPPPPGVRVTSIGARGDGIVPAIHTGVDGAHNVVVSVPGVWTDHSELPGSAAAQREVGLAVAGLAPTCQTLSDMLVDTAGSGAIAFVEDGVGAAAYQGGRRADTAVKQALKGALKNARRKQP